MLDSSFNPILGVLMHAILPPGTYVFAISGGVDSVVLLDMYARLKEYTIIVAHFDHGIRVDSSNDALFVADLARQYGLAFVMERMELGDRVGEEKARNYRYEFLFQASKTYKAAAVVTAHHQDDVIETIFINILRGTGWRGLCSLRSTKKIARPLLESSKEEIISYAEKENLLWREDSTNEQDIYTRNLIRHKVVSNMSQEQRHEILSLYQRQCELLIEINSECERLTSYRRYDVILWPREVAIEMLRFLVPLTRPQASRALAAIKTARPGAEIIISGSQKMIMNRDTFIVQPL